MTGFRQYLDLEGWKDEHAIYCVIMGHLSARQEGDAEQAKRFLSDAEDKFGDKWPFPAVQFLRGDIDESALLKAATNDDERTEAHCYLGLFHLVSGRKEEAAKSFQWVKDHGSREFSEYSIAVNRLEQLNSRLFPGGPTPTPVRRVD